MKLQKTEYNLSNPVCVATLLMHKNFLFSNFLFLLYLFPLFSWNIDSVTDEIL